MAKGYLDVIKERGLLAQLAHDDEFPEHIGTKRTAYAGFDPTAESLHVGHLLPVIALRRWQQAGHRAIVVMGGGTALVGDPTGKTEMRQMTTDEVINERIGYFKKQMSSLLDFSAPEKGIIVNNADWLKPISYLPMLREIGVHFSVNRMLTADCFKQRLEKGLSFLEFNYMILQSYDFWHLYKTYGCSVQLGGDDQWSNMLGGMELIRRKERTQAFCQTVPLLVNSAGKKMGKTEQGAVWIDPNLTSPFDFFQYFRNLEDDMIEKCLYYFTDLPVDEVKRLGSLQGKDINEAKVVLAYETTKLIHGEEEAKRSKERAAQLFSSAAKSTEDAPEVEIPSSTFGTGMNIIDLAVAMGIFASKGEARRMTEQGGLYLNETTLSDVKSVVSLAAYEETGVVLRKGKKAYYKLKLT